MTHTVPGCFTRKPTPSSPPPWHLPTEHTTSCPKCPGHPSLSSKEKREFAKKEKAAFEKQRKQVESYLKKIGKTPPPSPSSPQLDPSQSLQWASYLSALQSAQESQRAAEWLQTEADWLAYAKLLQAFKTSSQPPPAPPQSEMQAWQAYASVVSHQAQKEWEEHLASQKAAAEAASAASAKVWAERAADAEKAEQARNLETQRWIAQTMAKEAREKRERAQKEAKEAKEREKREAKEKKEKLKKEQKEKKEMKAKEKRAAKEKAAREKREQKERERKEREIDKIWKGASKGKLNKGAPAPKTATWDGFAELPSGDFAWRRPLDADHWPWPRASRTYTAAAREYAMTLDASRRGHVATL